MIMLFLIYKYYSTKQKCYECREIKQLVIYGFETYLHTYLNAIFAGFFKMKFAG